jgi:hypothetical protein
MTKVERRNFESMELIYSGDTKVVSQQYEKLANLVAEYGGRVHGSQISNDDTNFILAIYYQIPKESIEEFNREYS